MFLAPTLTVSLPAIVANWQLLRAQFTGEECAAVVKADAYGLGAVPVAQALERAGCHTFFVATLEEALTLRAALPDVRILVFQGVFAGEEFAFAAHRLIPVLNSPDQIARWKPVAAEHIHAVSALHIDTAMARMGLELQVFTALMAKHPNLLRECRVGLMLSHFACAPEADHPLNAAQLERFQQALALAPEIPASLCNSGGIFLPKPYHFHLARPGCALYGIAPQAAAREEGAGKKEASREEGGTDVPPPACGWRLGGGNPELLPPIIPPPQPSPASGGGSSPVAPFASRLTAHDSMHHVATWHAPILTTRVLERDQSVGYGASAYAAKGTRIATVMSGYADGYLRQLSGKGVGYLGAYRVPLIGRVTMDMLCFNVSQVPEALVYEGAPITLLGDADGIRVDDVAEAAGTIGYEILTRIGARVKRVYTE